MKNKPLIERVVTVTGKSVKNPGNFLCRIGTPISKLIEAAGGMPEDTAKVIGGGPMMGKNDGKHRFTGDERHQRCIADQRKGSGPPHPCVIVSVAVNVFLPARWGSNRIY